MIKRLVFILLTVCVQDLLAVVSLSIDVDRTTLSREDRLKIRVSVMGVRQSPAPQFPDTADFRIDYAGAASEVQIINGAMTAQTVFTYYLLPEKNGEIIVGPARVEIQGQIYQSRQLKLTVLDAGQRPPEQTYYYVEAEVDNTRPYVHQQIQYTLRFFTRAQIANANLKLAEFGGFWKESLGKEKVYQRSVGGFNWQVTEIKFALFADSPGEMTIDSAVLTLDAVLQRGRSRRFSFFDDPFFGSREVKSVRLKSAAIVLNVQPLPKTAQNKTFSGLVGQFSAQAKLTKNKAKTGESVTLLVTLQGNGNVWDATLQDIDFLGFKSYADKPELRKRVRQGQLVGSKEFRFALVPMNKGVLKLPRIDFLYFDPETQSYQQAQTDLLTMHIQAADEQESLAHTAANPGQRKQSIVLLGSDLMPIKADATVLGRDTMTAAEAFFMFATTVISPIAYLFAFAYRRRLQRIHSDSGFLRRQKAHKTFQAAIGALAQEQKFYDTAATALREYLRDKLNLLGSAITAADVERLLGKWNVPAERVVEIKSVLQKCEQGQYGGLSLTQEVRRELSAQLVAIGKVLERTLK